MPPREGSQDRECSTLDTNPRTLSNLDRWVWCCASIRKSDHARNLPRKLEMQRFVHVIRADVKLLRASSTRIPQSRFNVVIETRKEKLSQFRLFLHISATYHRPLLPNQHQLVRKPTKPRARRPFQETSLCPSSTCSVAGLVVTGADDDDPSDIATQPLTDVGNGLSRSIATSGRCDDDRKCVIGDPEHYRRGRKCSRTRPSSEAGKQRLKIDSKRTRSTLDQRT